MVSSCSVPFHNQTALDGKGAVAQAVNQAVRSVGAGLGHESKGPPPMIWLQLGTPGTANESACTEAGKAIFCGAVCVLVEPTELATKQFAVPPLSSFMCQRRSGRRLVRHCDRRLGRRQALRRAGTSP